MSSYGNEAGAWDGGPPGAEAEYATQRAPPSAAPLPTTDPWTGVSYSHYGPPQYDYQAYGAHSYGYNYDSSYYQASDSAYYDARNTYSTQHSSYDYQKQIEQPRSTYESSGYDDLNRRSYRSKSRSLSPYVKREREYSRKRESSYDSTRRRRSRDRSVKPKRKYTSSESSSSRSRSYSRLSKRDNKKRRSVSSNSSTSNTSYKKVIVSRDENSLTPPLRKKSSYSSKRSKSPESDKRSRSITPKYKGDKTGSKYKGKCHSSRESKVKEMRPREGSTPPRKRSITPMSPRANKKLRRSPTTPPKKSVTPPRKQKYKEQRSESSSKRQRDSSVTPPRCYARNQSSASSRSRSRSVTPKNKRTRSRTPKQRRSRSSSSQSSASSKPSRNKLNRRSNRKNSREKSRSKSRSKKRVSKSRSRSRKRSKSPRKSKSRSRSRNSGSGSRSRSASASDDERRGQFTVADRKRFWKLHRTMQEKKESAKSPPKEVKAPPGAVESTTVDDIEYGDPPELEGPNFAELLPTIDQYMSQVPTTSKPKALPIPIKNDGSFLEMFKKMQEETKKAEVEKKPEIKKPTLPFIGKRRGGRVLKTGLVKKPKAIDEQAVDNTPKDAWSLYMQEVKKYRETSCEEERKTRPLVK